MDPLSGAARVEISPLLGRHTRSGTPESLRLSDYQCIMRAIDQQDHVAAADYVRYTHELNLSMIFSGFEWVIRWPNFVAERKGSDGETATRKSAYALWRS